MQTYYTYDSTTKRLFVAPKYATLDAIDACGGYCPCQVKSASTKCHCKDFLKVKKIGEPCICGIYVKMAKDAKKKGAK